MSAFVLYRYGLAVRVVMTALLCGVSGACLTLAAFLYRDALPVALFLAAMALGLLFMMPQFFGRIWIVREGNIVTVTIGSWPTPPRRVELPGAQIRFGSRRVVRNGEPMFGVFAERTDQAAIFELGSHSRDEQVIAARVDALNAWLAEVSAAP